MTIARENQQLGTFRLLRLIGSGGMGEVWLAEDTKLLRPVAVRVLPHAIAANPEARARVVREAEIAAQLDHPSIAAVHSIEEHAGCLFIAMEYVEGRAFGTAIRDRELSDYDAVRIARDVAEALAVAHARGIVHRDLRPDNVMICAGKRVKLLGFGIAKPAVEPRTDVFSLGVLLYQALSGVPQFTGATAFATLRPDLPNELAAVIAHCLEGDSERRFANATELAEALGRVLPKLSRAALPATPSPMLTTAAEPEPKKRILIADDDPAIRRLFETLARRERIDCDGVSNGAEAIAALKSRDYALLFLDIMMPRIDGWGVLDYLRTRAKSRVPSLFIVTAFLDQTVSAADREIVSGIIYKPVDADDIAALMRECVRGGNATGVLRHTRHKLIDDREVRL